MSGWLNVIFWKYCFRNKLDLKVKCIMVKSMLTEIIYDTIQYIGT